MPAGPRANQIAELAAQILPLSKKARGMPVAAEDWNKLVSIVSALLKIDLDQDADVEGDLAKTYARADHAHEGQVSLSWLDAGLQSRLASGGSDPISTRQTVATIQKTVTDLRDEVTRLNARIELQQSRIDDSVSAELDRTRRLTQFDARLAGLTDLRTTVAGIASTQAALGDNVNEVLKLRGQLTDTAGAAIDVLNLKKRVDDLDTLRGSLTGINGQPLRLRDLEIKVTELADKLPDVVGGASSAALDVRFADLETKLAKRIAEDGTQRISDLRAELVAADAAVSNRLTTQFDKKVRLGGSGTLEAATSLINAAEGRLKTSLASQIETTRAALTIVAGEQATTAVTLQLTNLDTRIGSIVDTRAAGIEQRLDSTLAGKVDTAVSTGIGNLSQSLDGRLASLVTRLDAMPDSITAEIKETVEAASASQQTWFTKQFDQKATDLTQSLSGMITAGVRTGLDAEVGNIRSIASQAVTDQLENLDARISDSVGRATSDLPGRIETIVATKFSQANIAGQIAEARNGIVLQFREEIRESAATVQRDTDIALKSAVVKFSTASAAQPVGHFSPGVLLTPGGFGGG